MTTTNSIEHATTLSRPVVFNPPGVWYSRVRAFQATVTLAGQASGDDVTLFQLPAGFRPAYGTLASSVSLGSAQIAIGKAGATGKYRAAATFATPDSPALFGALAATSGPLGETENAILTVSTAALPASGTLVIRLYGTGAD